MSAVPPGSPVVPHASRSTAWTRPATGRQGRRDGHRAIAALLATFDVVVLALVAGGVTGRLREVAGLVFCLLVPGWSVVGLARLRDTVLEFSLAMATGLASLLVLAQFVISVQAWHLFGVQVAVCVVCLAALGYQVVRRESERPPS